jgi:hypothetical protein
MVDKDIDVESPDYTPLSIDCKAVHETCTYWPSIPLKCVVDTTSNRKDA